MDDTSMSPIPFFKVGSPLHWKTVFDSSQSLVLYLPITSSNFASVDISKKGHSEAYLTMLASEKVLREDWEQPEEDAAWKDL